METLPSVDLLSTVPMPRLNAEAIEKALMVGDLSKMSPEVRIQYYLATCQSAGLNPLTRPLTALKTQSGEVVLYANKDAAEQLRAKHQMSIRVLRREYLDDTLWCVTVEGSLPNGRVEESQGIVDLVGLKGQAKGNAMLKAETKAKRRVTLGLCGLGITFLDDAPGIPTRFSPQTGEIFEEGMRTAHTNDDAIEALYGERAGLSLPASAQNTPDADDASQATAAALVDAITRAIADGGGNVERYWSKVRASFVIDDPAHLTVEQLRGMLMAVEQQAMEREAERVRTTDAVTEDQVTDTDIPF